MGHQRLTIVANISLSIGAIALLLCIATFVRPVASWQISHRDHKWSIVLQRGVLALDNRVEIDESENHLISRLRAMLADAAYDSDEYRSALKQLKQLEDSYRNKPLPAAPASLEYDLPLLPLILLTTIPPLLRFTTWRSDRPLRLWGPRAIGFAMAWLVCFAMMSCWIYGFNMDIMLASWGNPRETRHSIWVEKSRLGSRHLTRIGLVTYEGFRPPVDSDPLWGGRLMWAILGNSQVQYSGYRSVKINNGLLDNQTEGLSGTQTDTYIWIGWPTLIALPFLIWSVLIFRANRLRVRRRAAGLCVECGYDLRENTSGVCSECGAESRHATTDDAHACSNPLHA